MTLGNPTRVTRTPIDELVSTTQVFDTEEPSVFSVLRFPNIDSRIWTEIDSFTFFVQPDSRRHHLQHFSALIGVSFSASG